MTCLCSQRNFLICSKPPLEQVVTLELQCLMNTMTNIYLHNAVWEQSNPLPFQNLAFCILTLCSCLIRSLSSMSPSLDGSGKLRVPLGKTESLLGCICGSTWFLGTLAAPSLAVVDWHKHQSFSWLRTNVVLSPSHYASCAVPATSLI